MADSEYTAVSILIDQQTCQLILTSWTEDISCEPTNCFLHHGDRLLFFFWYIVVDLIMDGAAVNHYVPSEEWQLMSKHEWYCETSHKRCITYYICRSASADINGSRELQEWGSRTRFPVKLKFPVLTITIRMRRYSVYYVRTIIIPSIFISCLLVLSFLIPPKSVDHKICLRKPQSLFLNQIKYSFSKFLCLQKRML